jgi:hypothetical protein
VRTVKDPVRP